MLLHRLEPKTYHLCGNHQDVTDIESYTCYRGIRLMLYYEIVEKDY